MCPFFSCLKFIVCLSFKSTKTGTYNLSYVKKFNDLLDDQVYYFALKIVNSLEIKFF